jgi:hypothetical protein
MIFAYCFVSAEWSETLSGKLNSTSLSSFRNIIFWLGDAHSGVYSGWALTDSAGREIISGEVGDYSVGISG